MQIRLAEVGDQRAIAALLTDLGYPVTEAFMAQSIQRQLEHPDAALLVAVDQEIPVGVISLNFMPQLALAGDFCRISYFCVSPEVRGRGVGAALEAYACRLARARGCDRIEVHCHSRRDRAHPFYHRQGYSESPKYLVKSLRSRH
jgi:GNAT superfamily N-acetyltransferase